MLILTRKKGESIIISGNIEIQIMNIEDGKVKIGIEAPKEVSVFRSEVLETIKNENKNSVVDENILEKLSKNMIK